MSINQLNVTYNDRHDRMLLRLNTRAGQEFRFWLTRRLVLRLKPVLKQALGRLESTMPNVVAPDESSREVLTELKHEAFLEQADFKSPYAEQATQLPLGEEPMLVTEVKMNSIAGGLNMQFRDAGLPDGGGQMVEMVVTAELLHALMELLEAAMVSAQWLEAANDVGAAVPLPEAPPPAGYRH